MEAEAGSLVLVPTPIGNLGDITLRALDVLKEADLILAEDTRRTGTLLKHFGIKKPIQSYHNFNEHKIVTSVIGKIKEGERIALVSDAGTPGISDPGYLIVREALAANVRTECLPGPTAFVPALVQSGLPTDRFCFEGFLPAKKGRTARLEKLKEEERTMVFYESPYRLLKTLEQLGECLGKERKVSVSKELSKIYEETTSGILNDIIDHFSKKDIKGEFVIVVEGKK